MKSERSETLASQSTRINKSALSSGRKLHIPIPERRAPRVAGLENSMNLQFAIVALGPIGSIAIYHALRGAVGAIRRLRTRKSVR